MPGPARGWYSKMARLGHHRLAKRTLADARALDDLAGIPPNREIAFKIRPLQRLAGKGSKPAPHPLAVGWPLLCERLRMKGFFGGNDMPVHDQENRHQHEQHARTAQGQTTGEMQ